MEIYKDHEKEFSKCIATANRKLNMLNSEEAGDYILSDAKQSIDEAGLSPMARGFYAENRRVSNLKAKRLLGWEPTYFDYKQGLAAISVTESENRD